MNGKTFLELRSLSHTLPEAIVTARLAALLETSALHYWQPGDAIEQAIPRCLIGVAVWSGYDLQLLEDVNAWLQQSEENRQSVRFDVFDFGVDWRRLEQYIPNLSLTTLQEPVVGYWVGGKLLWKAQGFQAKKRVHELLI